MFSVLQIKSDKIIQYEKGTDWGTLRKEGAPMIYIWLLFGLWCHNPMLAILAILVDTAIHISY